MTTNREKANELLKLVAENPELEVIPSVHYEVCGGDYGYWVGEWSSCRVEKYWRDDVRLYTFDDYVELCEDWECRHCDDEEYANMPEEEFEKLAKDMVAKYDWKEAIIVYIDVAY